MLTNTQVKAAKTGIVADHNGLYLEVKATGTRSWLYRFTLNGKRRMMGLGAYPDTTLEQARIATAEARKLVKAGTDPIAAREASKVAVIASSAPAKTFKALGADYIDKHRASWKNAKHHDQWVNTLRDYAEPVIGNMAPADITKDHVLEILNPIWLTKNETAVRLRGRIESILDYAAFHGLTDKPNPARFKGFLDQALAAPSKVNNRQHFKAMAYSDVPAFMLKLQAEAGHGARCLEFTILTACRSGEALGAEWSEFDLAAKTWTVPAVRMKAGKAHRFALSDAAIKLLEAQKEADKKFVFPSRKPRTQMSNMAMSMIVRKMKVDCTVHGFRSSFRDWCAEQTSHPSEVAEMALAHTVGDKVEAAYRRGDMLAKRHALANDWAAYCIGK
jgi:integrase